MRRPFATLLLLPLFASVLGAQAPARPTSSSAKLPYDSTVVRTLLADAVSAARQAPRAERSPLLAAIGRTQVSARDFDGAARTLRLVSDESPADVLHQLGEPEIFAGFYRAGLARRLSCGLREADRPDDALAVIRGMTRGKDREWELEFAAVLTARGSTSPLGKKHASVPPDVRGRKALDIARGIALPAARLDALLGIAGAMPDTGPARAVLERAYTDARRITLTDVDRQRSRDAMLATEAIALHRTDDVRALYARLTDVEDVQLVFGVAAGQKDAAPLARELAPRAIAAGRAIHDSVARSTNLVGLWEQLKKLGGRPYADSLLPEGTYRAEHPIDLRAMLDSAKAAHPDTSPLARAAWPYSDSTRIFLLEARRALLATPHDSAAFDDEARDIAMQQFRQGDDDEGIATLNLVRDPGSVEYTIREWGNSTFSHLDAHKLRGYADRFHDPVVRDMVLEHVIDPYLTSRNASPADVAWARALADSITTPDIRREARRVIANRALADGDGASARRQLLALLNERELSPEEEANSYGRGLAGDLIRAGGWRDAIEWARRSPAPASRARRLVGIAAQLQRNLDVQEQRMMLLSNGPEWCVDEF